MVATNTRSDPPNSHGGSRRVAHWLTPRTQLSSPLARVMMFTPLHPTIYEDSVLETNHASAETRSTAPPPSTITIAYPTPRYPSSDERNKLQQLTRKLRREKRRLFLQSVQDGEPSPSPKLTPRSMNVSDFKVVAQNFKRLKIRENEKSNDDINAKGLLEPLDNNALVARARAA